MSASSPFKKRDVVQTTIAQQIDSYMRSIKGMFPGENKLTLVIRSSSMRDPVIMTNDNPEEIIKAVNQMRAGQNGLFIQ